MCAHVWCQCRVSWSSPRHACCECCAKHTAGQSTPFAVFRVAKDLLRESEVHAQPSKLEASRLAAAAALRLSRLLHITVAEVGAPSAGEDDVPVTLALRAWGLAVLLAEDEDDAVRCVMRAVCCACCVNRIRLGNCHCHADSGSTM